MEYTKYIILFTLFLVYTHLLSQTNKVEMVLTGPKTVNYKNRMVVNASFLNNTKDTISLYHPGILFSAFSGIYAKNSPRYSFGILKSDSLVFWKGNCGMDPPRQKLYLSCKNGLTIIFPKRQERLRNTIFSISPGSFLSLNVLIVLTDCYQLENNQKYSLSLTYNHPVNTGKIINIRSERSIDFTYTTSAMFDFIYVGKE